MNLFRESVDYNISTILPDFGLGAVTGAAFSLARYKIDLSFFKDLNGILAGFHREHPQKLWRGRRLVAGDGSTVGLPPSRQIKDFFGVHAEKDCGIKSCMAQVFMFYDVFSGAVLSHRISKIEVDEKTLFGECLGELPSENPVVVLDRGFGYLNICKKLYNQKLDFCIRISSSSSSFARKAMERAQDDFVTEWEASPKERETLSRHALDRAKVPVRVTKIMLKTGETELLVSSLLDMDAVRTRDMKELYHLRWPIEEAFKKLKPKMKLEQFGCRKPDGIFQEFEAHIFMMNLIALIGIQAQQEINRKCKKRKLKYRYNWQNAFRHVRKMIVRLLNAKDPTDMIKSLVKVVSSSRIPIKPQREFHRSKQKPRKNRLHQTYK